MWERTDEGGVDLLDLLAEVADLPPGERRKRLEDSSLSPAARERVERWVALGQGAEGFMADAPPAVVDALARLVRGGGGDRVSPRVDSDVQVRPRVAGYEVKELLGSGGMGRVWRAVQVCTRRDVALKVMSALQFASPGGRLQFDREVRLAARLEHPGIARIYDSGFDGTNYYYAMELVEGVPLDEHVRGRALGMREVVELMAAVCRAVAHAHQNGVIHRDLKPGNILVSADGRPRLLDFGLARALYDADGEVTISMDGGLAGTPAYMSPEQVVGPHDGRLDTRSDVYSLGVILYRLLTGQSPHDLSGSRLEVLHRIGESEVRRPRQLDKRVGAELEAVLLKALARDPAGRYATAAELAAELDRYLRGEPLVARMPSLAYLIGRRLWMHRVRLSIAAAVMGAVAGAGLYASRYLAEQRRRSDEQVQILLVAESAAQSGSWIVARSRYDDAISRGHRQIDVWCKDAYLHLILGERDAYRERCRALLSRADELMDAGEATMVAETCLVAAGAVDDWGTLQRVIDRTYIDPSKRPRMSFWHFLYKGIAAYRLGRWQESLRWFAESRGLSVDPHWESARDYFEAMAYYRSGRRSEAQASFSRGDACYIADPLIVDRHWTNLLLRHLARSEAEAVLGADAPDPGWWTYRPRREPITIPALIQAEDYDEGGEGVGYHDYDGPNFDEGWIYRPGAVDLKSCRLDQGGGLYVASNRPGEWVAYTIEVAQAGTYDFEFRVSQADSGAQFHAEIDGRDLTGPVNVPPTPNWDVFETLTRPGLRLPAGRHVIRIVFDRAAGGTNLGANLNWFRITKPPATGAVPKR
jgi:tetratricopeptide (TPR) repeat protein